MIKFYSFIIIIVLASFPASTVYAVDKIEVQALMPGMVVLLIDDQRVTLKNGQSTLHGVRLISSTTESALLEINGEQKTFSMGSSVSTHFTQRAVISEQLNADDSGMFHTHGSINGQSIYFLVDTGATAVAMSSAHARQLGIQYRLIGDPVKANTASGVTDAWSLNLDSVRLGALVEKNVRGVVVDGNYPTQVLLGMTFLNRMKVAKEGKKMIISKKQ